MFLRRLTTKTNKKTSCSFKPIIQDEPLNKAKLHDIYEGKTPYPRKETTHYSQGSQPWKKKTRSHSREQFRCRGNDL